MTAPFELPDSWTYSSSREWREAEVSGRVSGWVVHHAVRHGCGDVYRISELEALEPGRVAVLVQAHTRHHVCGG